MQRKNFVNVQNDAVGVGLSNAATQYLSIFLARLGATTFQVGLLTSMPALAGLLLAIPVGRFLHSRRQIVPWFSGSRLLVITCFALTGLVPFVVPEAWVVPAVLGIWLVATIPQIVLGVTFSVVMNAVAGPRLRYDLMSRRWSILGLTTAIAVAVTGQVLDRFQFPINFQWMFIILSIGGLISFYFSSHIQIPATEPALAGLKVEGRPSLRERVGEYLSLIRRYPDFTSFTSRRFLVAFGLTLSVPIFPMYYVRTVEASNAWIGYINTVYTAVLLLGYFVWTRLSKGRGSRFVLLATALGAVVQPLLVALTTNLQAIVILSAVAGFFQAGLELVFFDEQMKTVPVEFSAIFISFAQSVLYLAALLAPLLGTLLSDTIGIQAALVAAAVIRFVGFLLFLSWRPGAIPTSANSGG